MTQWQPIETAPKDKDVVLWYGRANVGGWHDEWTYDTRAGDKRDCWVINGGYVVTATHWLPLPEPPQSVSEEAGSGDA